MITVPLEQLTDEIREGSVSITTKDGLATVYYAGDTIPALEVTKPPIIVRLTQFRIALQEMGLLDTINAAVAAADEQTKVWWEYSVDVYSDNPRIAAMASALGLSQAQVNAAFTMAESVRY